MFSEGEDGGGGAIIHDFVVEVVEDVEDGSGDVLVLFVAVD